jgi:DNA processing protein
MNATETQLCLRLHGTPELVDTQLVRLLEHCGSPQAIADGGPGAWREAGLPAATITALGRTLRGPGSDGPFDIAAQARALAGAGATVLPLTDPAYPPLLRTIHDPPPLLYVRGDPAALGRPQLAMVGSRKASSAGLRAAATFAAEAVAAGLAITSGLALGIDAAAHRGALGAGGCSVAVVATGVEQVYPLRHRALAAELEQAGCLLSEFPPGVPPLPQNFPRRNRIISGLALGVMVIEAALPSGSLITARTAMEQGREVFALPWSIFHRGGAGCLRLLRDGVKMVEVMADVLEELGALYGLQQELSLPDTAVGSSPAPASLSAEQTEILQLLGYEETATDELLRQLGVSVAGLMAALSEMEMQGLVVRGPGGYMRA